MRKYVIMGAQGSGKGTQAKMLARDLDLVHISVGDIFRWHIQNRTKLAARVRRTIADGQLVPDDIVDEVVKDRLQRHDWNYGFILDGFPRNETQARFFLESYDIDAVILLDVPDSVVTERIMSRRVCSQCGLDYNLIYHRPKTPDTCDVCKGPLAGRPDDGLASLHERLLAYHERTRPILALFSSKELVIKVDGTQEPDALQGDIRRRLRVPHTDRT